MEGAEEERQWELELVCKMREDRFFLKKINFKNLERKNKARWTWKGVES